MNFLQQKLAGLAKVSSKVADPNFIRAARNGHARGICG